MEIKPLYFEKISQDKRNKSKEGKETFKAKLRGIFEAGKNPITITNLEIAEILGIETDERKMIDNRLRSLFGKETSYKEIIKTQYRFFLEDQRDKK